MNFIKNNIFLQAAIENLKAFIRQDRKYLRRFSRHAIERNELRNYKQF